MSLPPHTTHKLQPPNCAFFKQLKSNYNQAADKWMRNHPGRPITVYKICGLFGEAYVRSSVVGKYRFWHISPYTWLNLSNYIQTNHIRGWDSVIIRHHPCSNHTHGWTQSQIHRIFDEIYEMNHSVVRFSGTFQ